MKPVTDAPAPAAPASTPSPAEPSPPPPGPTGRYDVEAEVKQRYAAGAGAVEACLCCPVEYDVDALKMLPKEIIEKDYGCGDPTRYAKEGDHVVDLGSGGGKACYILAKKVGPNGSVTGVDFNDPMLALARKYQGEMADKLGYANTRFVKGRIQDLRLDLDAAQALLDASPITGVDGLAAFEASCEQLRAESPMIASDSVDLVVSNCVLNLVKPSEKTRLFAEIFRVLKKGGRAVISDIVCDEPPTDAIMNDPELWSGCISGAFLEEEFLQRFVDAGFYGVELLERTEEPWRTIDGIEFRSVTVRAYKGKQGPCVERNQAVVYKGPWAKVHDDDGHVLPRGARMAVCDKTFRLMTDPDGPYAGQVEAVLPLEDVPLEEAASFDCKRSTRRHPRETKGAEYDATTQAGDCCGPEGCC